MKAKILIVTFIISGIVSCTKNQYTTAPQLIFKSVSTNELFRGQSIIFTLEYTDKEGDIQDTIFIQKVTSNCIDSDSKENYLVPEFPQVPNSKGEIQVRYSYGSNLEFFNIKEPACPGLNDTCVYKFILKDRAGNVSDTATSSQIVLVKS